LLPLLLLRQRWCRVRAAALADLYFGQPHEPKCCCYC
jgi:hypothetical protein